MKRLFLIIAAILMSAPVVKAAEEEAFDPGSMIIGHVTDAHTWHILDYKSKDGKDHAVAVPLPPGARSSLMRLPIP